MLTVNEVRSPAEIKQFIAFPWQVYRRDPNWVPPLIFDMKATLDKKKNPFFEFAEAAYFMAFRDGRPVGRITAQVNDVHNRTHHVREGFFGFYECLEDDEASQALLAAAENWARAKGMTRMIGPENFSVYDEIGFMVEGWDATPSTPVVLETYTPKYYPEYMEKAGYQKEIDWIAFKVTADFPIKDAFLKIKDRIIQRNGFTFRTINLNNLAAELELIKVIFREAWSENWGHYPLSDRQFDKIAEALKVIADERILFMVEDHGRPVACSVSLPDINPSVKKMNGRLLPFGWYHFLTAKRKATGIRTFMMGVQKEYRRLGVDIALVVETFLRGREAGYQWAECSLIVETNQRMIDPIVKWGGKPYKVYRLYGKTL